MFVGAVVTRIKKKHLINLIRLVKPVDVFLYFLIWDRFSLLFLKHVNNELNYQKQRIKFYFCFIQ
jgi:hypothetical protein